MGIIRNFELRLEKAFEGTFSRIFKVGVHPVEIAKRVSREAEAGKRVATGEVLMPNLYEIFLSPVDFDRLAGYQASLLAELETLAFDVARKNGYTTLTRPTFVFRRDDSLKEGQFELEARITSSLPRPDHPPAAAPSAPPAAPPTATLSVTGGADKGVALVLERLPATLGRSADNHLALDDQLVSRHHAVIREEAGRFVLADLGSTNGTFVDGRRVKERVLSDGDVIRLGGTTLLFSLA